VIKTNAVALKRASLLAIPFPVTLKRAVFLLNIPVSHPPSPDFCDAFFAFLTTHTSS
jgi:hypothetical protein